MIIFRGASQLVDVEVNNNTILRQRLVGEDMVTTSFTLETNIGLRLGDYINFGTKRYTISKQPQVKKSNVNEWVYNVEFSGPDWVYTTKLFLLDGLTDFPLRGDLGTFIALIVDNMNRLTGATDFNHAAVPDTSTKDILFQDDTCMSALTRICSEFDVEYRISDDGFTITVGESLGADTGLTFEYKNGLRNIERREISDGKHVTRLYPFGSQRNTIELDYGSKRLRLAASPYYIEQNVGTFGVIERSVTFEDIYPRRTGTVTAIDGSDELLFRDSSMDFNLNDQLINETAKMTFNTGDLAGFEFEISLYNDTTKEFKLIPITNDQDTVLPNSNSKPRLTDEYVLHDIKMPQTYIDAAEAELATRANEYLTKYSSPNVVYSITPDPTYFRTNLISLKVGDLITIVDTDFGLNIQTKVIGLTQSIANPYLYTIEVGTEVVISYLQEVSIGILANSNVIRRQNIDRRVDYYRVSRRISDLNTITDSIFDVDGYFDPTKIRPLSIETGALSVGSKPLQLQFSDLEIEPNYQGNPDNTRFSNCQMVHFTIEANPRTWTITGNTFNITDGQFHYIYCVVNENTPNTGVFELNTEQRKIDHTSGKYTFLIGVLHAEQANTRGVSLLYGQTFINGKFITTGRIQSLTGGTYMDLDNNQFFIGDSSSSLDWNVTQPNTLSIKGTIIQSPSGQTQFLPVHRGAYDNGTDYYQGDTVLYNGSTWMYINTNSSSGNVPQENAYWTLYASSGTDGVDGQDGQDGDIGPAGPAGADGINGVDGLNGTNGTDGFGSVPYDISPATIGSIGDAQFYLDMVSESSINVGEVFMRCKTLRDRQGNIMIDSLFKDFVHTPFGEGKAGIFYLVWHKTTNWSTLSGDSSGNVRDIRLGVLWYNGSNWRCQGNTLDFSITLDSNMVFLAAVEAKQTTGGLTGFVSFVQGAKGFDGHEPGAFFDDFTQYEDEIDFFQKWENYSGSGEIAFISSADAEVGTQSLRIGNNSGNDMRWLISKQILGYDPEDLYQIKVKWKQQSGGSGAGAHVYFGVAGRDVNGNLVNASGSNSYSSQHYIAEIDFEPTNGTTYTSIGYFQGIGSTGNGGQHLEPSDPATIHQNAVGVSPLMLVNYSNQDGQIYIHSFEIKKINDFSPIPRGTWSAGTSYRRGDVVTHNSGSGSQSYIALRPNNGFTPPNATYWQLIAQAGATGPAGADGSDGATGPQGPQGATGATGPAGPGLVFRGEFANGTVYYNNSTRRDVVRYNSSYYLYSSTNGAAQTSWVSSRWTSFGANFSSVATNLLLAENANIADWIISNGRIESQDGNTTLYGGEGRIVLLGSAVDGQGSLGTLAPDQVLITGQGQKAATVGSTPNSDGSLSYTQSTLPYASIVGRTERTDNTLSGVAGVYGFGKNNGVGGSYGVYGNGGSDGIGVFGQTSSGRGVQGTASLSSGYAGYFFGKTLIDGQLIMKGVVRTSGNYTMTTANKTWCVIHVGTSSSYNVYLPSAEEIGMICIVKRSGNAGVFVNGNGRNIWHNANEGSSVGIPSTGEGVIMIYDGTYWQMMFFQN